MQRIATFLSALLSIWLMAGASDLSSNIPRSSLYLNGYNDIDSVKAGIDNRGPVDIEGIWKMTDTQTLVVIEPASAASLTQPGYEAYQIVVLSSPRKSLRPGTILGYAAKTARHSTYEAYLYTTKTRAILSGHRQFTLRLSDNDHLSMTAEKSRWHINLRHTLRFFVRAGISIQNKEDSGHNGFIKQYPVSEGKPSAPVYL